MYEFIIFIKVFTIT